jgi:metal-responsive CopG/Arc/MetJ family transcriptional regulator
MYTIHEKVLNELEKASSNYKISKSRIIENALIDYLRIEVDNERETGC